MGRGELEHIRCDERCWDRCMSHFLSAGHFVAENGRHNHMDNDRRMSWLGQFLLFSIVAIFCVLGFLFETFSLVF